MDKVLYSSKSIDWETPQKLFNILNKEFKFTLDPCADPKNAKCKKFYTKEIDGLSQDWTGEVVYCNPPYGSLISLWVEKAYKESIIKKSATVVMLLPARTDTRWFHRYIYGFARIHFIKGRLRFNGLKQNAPFPSMIVIFKPDGVQTSIFNIGD